MDLLRIALGLHRGSAKMAQRFKEEALKRQQKLEAQPLTPYLRRLLVNSKKSLTVSNADDILMFSVLFQNFVRKFCP